MTGLGVLIGLALLIFLVLPLLAWRSYGISYKKYLEAILGRRYL